MSKDLADLLRQGITKAVSDTLPGFSDSVRRIKASGGEKSAVVSHATRVATIRGLSPQLLNALLLTVDEIWKE